MIHQKKNERISDRKNNQSWLHIKSNKNRRQCPIHMYEEYIMYTVSYYNENRI